MIPLFNLDGTSTSPLGMPMCQNRLAVPTWSYAMEVHPPARVLEIGSYNGALATALGLHCRAIGAEMHTYDLNPCDERIVPIGRALGVQFHTGSVWDAIREIGRLIASPGVTFVLCDGGDKPRELATFAPFCKPGDVIAAHDYDAVHERDPSVPQPERFWPWTEIRKADGDRVAAAYGFDAWLQEHFDQAGWLCYRKRPLARGTVPR